MKEIWKSQLLTIQILLKILQNAYLTIPTIYAAFTVFSIVKTVNYCLDTVWTVRERVGRVVEGQWEGCGWKVEDDTFLKKII